MEEWITALMEILQAASAEEDNDLEGVIINDQENVLPVAAEDKSVIMLTVSEDMEEYPKATDFHFELVDGYVYLVLITPVDKKAVNTWRLAKQLLKPYVKNVRKAIMSNPTFVCASYPSGICQNRDKTKFQSTKYGFNASGTQWHVFARLRLQAQYIYRNGTISIQ